MTFPEEIFFATLSELSTRLRAREFTAREFVEAVCDRLEKIGPRYNALALLLREDADAKARRVDDELKRGRFRALMQGVPYGAKDLFAYHGHPTTWGAKPYAGQVFEEDAVAIQKLDKVGAVLSAKLAMVELAGGGGYRFPSASLTGPGLNPWDRTRWAGGSSSGSGAAVAAGLVPFALGSETSGSILTPAAFCGVTGLRPTYGVVSRKGAMPLSWTLDKVGPLARCAEDCGLILQTIAGGDGGKGFYYAPEYARPIKELRGGFASVDVEQWADEPLRPALRQAMQVFREMGLSLQETQLPEFPYGALTGTIIGAEGASVFSELIESGQVDQLADARQIAGLKAAYDIPARDYLRAMRIRRDVQNAFGKLFFEVDVLVTPSRFGVASKVSDPLDRASTPRPDNTPRGLRDLIPAGNLAGLPALSLPCGFADGLPAGICLVGRPYSENLLFSLGREFQKRTNWHRERPRIS